MKGHNYGACQKCGRHHQHPRLGKHCSKETKHKIGLANTGRIRSIETRQKLSLAGKGRSHSELHKLRIGLSNAKIKRPYAAKNLTHGTGPANSFYGRHHSDETKAKLRAYTAKQKFPRISSIEKKLGEAMIRQGIVAEPQVSLESVCRADFFLDPNIVIFCDGDYWHRIPSTIERDDRQNRLLKKLGYQVLRFWEHEILSDVSACVHRVQECLA